MVGRDTPEPIRSGRPCKTSHGAGCGQRTENPPALAVGSVNFIEVKLRKNADFAPARAAVDRRKQERLRTSAELYLSQHPTDLQPRFDVAEVYAPDGIATRAPEIIYIEDAF